MISKCFAALNDYKSALNYSNLHFIVYDSVFKKESVDKINELED